MNLTNEVSTSGSTEERDVARYLRDIARFAPLSATTEGDLVLTLPHTESETALIEGYLHAVVRIALQYQGQGMSVMDLISEGNLCLVQIVQTFHATATTQFHCSLETALHDAMQRAIRSDTVHDPQVSSSCSCRPCPPPEDALIAKEACIGILSILGRLSPKQRLALAHYYGFIGPIHGSFAAIGRQWGVSGSAVRSSVTAGLQKLRRARAELSDLLDEAFSLFP